MKIQKQQNSPNFKALKITTDDNKALTLAQKKFIKDHIKALRVDGQNLGYRFMLRDITVKDRGASLVLNTQVDTPHERGLRETLIGHFNTLSLLNDKLLDNISLVTIGSRQKRKPDASLSKVA